MKKALLAAVYVCCASTIGACHEPVVPDSGTKPTGGGVHIPSASEISADKERYYAQQLPILQAKNPVADAQAALAKGERYFLCNAGRSTTVPGIDADAYAKASAHCQTQCLDGVTDAIYGENHRRYLAVALDYSARWNQTMLPTCQ